MNLPLDTTLREAKRRLSANWDQPNGDDCPCCGQRVALRKRKLNSRIAGSLLALYRAKGSGWGHIPTLIGDGCELNKARYWGLVEEATDKTRLDGGHAGYWRLTSKGVLFVLGQASVPTYAHVFNSRCFGLSGDPTTIRACLADPFSYDELVSTAGALPTGG